MKKKKIIVIVLIAIAAFVTIFGLFILISRYNSASSTIDLQVPLAINRSTEFNENGYYTYVIEGVINKIQSTDPLMIDITIRTENILPGYSEPLIKTIILGEEAQVIIRNLATNEESTISAFTSLKKDDDIVAWLVEPNTKLLELDKFAATKIIINR